MNWYLTVVRDNYANFQGRARRKEYWMFMLVHTIIWLVLYLIIAIFSPSEEALLNGASLGFIPMLMSGLGLIYILATLVPTLAVTARRLHDTDRSGWWQLLNLIPLLSLIVLVFTILEGTRGDNRFGPDPKAFE